MATEQKTSVEQVKSVDELCEEEAVDLKEQATSLGEVCKESAGDLKEQVTSLCELCEEEAVLWKCLTCNTYICTGCRNIHKKIKSDEEHRIAKIRDLVSSEEQSKKFLNFRNIECKIHPDESYRLFCSKCEEPICLVCIGGNHNSHPVISLEDGLKISLKILEKYSLDITEDIQKLDSGIQWMREAMNTDALNKEKEKILNQRKSLINTIKLYKTKHIYDLDERWDLQTNTVQKQLCNFEDSRQNVQKEQEGLETIIEEGNPIVVFESSDDQRNSKRKKMTPLASVRAVVEFVPGDFGLSAYGSFVDHGIEAPIEFIYIKKCTLDLDYVSHLKLSSDQFLLMIDNPRDRVKTSFGKTMDNKEKNQDGELLTCKMLNLNLYEWSDKVGSRQNTSYDVWSYDRLTLDTDIKGIAILPSGEILLSCGYGKLKIYSHKTGKIIDSKYSCTPLVTNSAIHVTKDGYVMVGAKETRSSKCKLIVMDLDGNHKTVYEPKDESEGKKSGRKEPCRMEPFTEVIKVASLSNGDICVIDCYKGHGFCSRDKAIVIFKQSGKVRKIYNGPDKSDDRLFSSFSPSNLLRTSSDNIVVSDLSYLYILNADGQCVKQQRIRDLLDIGLNFHNRPPSLKNFSVELGKSRIYISYTVNQSGQMQVFEMSGF